jgi:ubiquinone/menaquinone biosynthesis C-methylase UbiE
MWDQLGRRNAFGAILTGEEGQLPAWDLERFFATGQEDADRFIAALDTLLPSAPRTRALDFGCGVGRVTRALATHFQEVVGVDVAASMIDQARALNDNPRCTFVLNRARHLGRFSDATFAVVYSRLVLQHIRPVFVRRYIPELVRVLAPGGALMFQLPETVAVDSIDAFVEAPLVGGPIKRRLPRPVVAAYRRLKYRLIVDESQPRMHMFGMPRGEVTALIQRAGGRLVDVRRDDSHGLPAPGFEYWITR